MVTERFSSAWQDAVQGLLATFPAAVTGDHPPAEALPALSWIVRQDHAVVGLATLIQAQDGLGRVGLFVAAAWQRQGLGRGLWAHLITQAPDLDITRFEGYVTTTAAQAFLASVAPEARPVGAFTRWVQRGPLTVPPIPDPAWQLASLAERPLTGGLARLYAYAYSGLPGHNVVAVDTTPEAEAELQRAFDLHSVWVVWCAGQPIGVTRLEQEDSGVVDGPGFVAAHRQPAAYAWLAAAALEQAGEGAVLHSWGDGPEILQAYRQLGLEVVEESPIWACTLT